MSMRKLVVMTLGAGTLLAQTYYPPSESAGGWRRSANDEDVRNEAHMDPHRLQLIAQAQSQFYGGPWAIAIVRNGYLVAEWFGMPAMPATTFDVWSCTKSATGIAFGMLFDDSRNNKLPDNTKIDLDSAAYDFIPEGRPLTDPRKAKIQLKHLMSMTSGIPGQAQGLASMPGRAGPWRVRTCLGKGPQPLWNLRSDNDGRAGRSLGLFGCRFCTSFPNFRSRRSSRNSRLHERAGVSTDRNSELWLGLAGRRRAHRAAHERAQRPSLISQGFRPARLFDGAPRSLGRKANCSRVVDRAGDAKFAKPESELRVYVLGEHGRHAVAQRSPGCIRLPGVRGQPMLRRAVAGPGGRPAGLCTEQLAGRHASSRGCGRYCG